MPTVVLVVFWAEGVAAVTASVGMLKLIQAGRLTVNNE